MKPFRYLEPVSLQEAVSMLKEHGDKAKVVAGGTDLVVQMRGGAVTPDYVVNISFVPDLNYVIEEGNEVRIGALTTVRSVEKSSVIRRRHAVVAESASRLGSVAVRHMATLGGNLCNASPSADFAPALLALSAEAKIVGSMSERTIPLEDFFVGPGKTSLERGELLSEVRVPNSPPRTGGVYLKHAVRNAMDLAIVGVATVVTLGQDDVCEDVRIVLGAVGPTPIRVRLAEGFARGKVIDEAVIGECADAAFAAACPISDVRASAEYRREMVRVFTAHALRKALEAARVS